MVDIDRGLRYYLPDCDLTQNAIMRRYDSNDRTESAYRDTTAYYLLVNQLQDHAEGAPSNV